MPFIDVTELLYDPDFATTFDVLRSVSTTAANGETVLTQSTTSGVVGVVTPATSNDLLRIPDTDRVEGTISIYTTFRLTNGDGINTADIVAWNGSQYTVMTQDDWTQWGAGFVKALATRRSLR